MLFRGAKVEMLINPIVCACCMHSHFVTPTGFDCFGVNFRYISFQGFIDMNSFAVWWLDEHLGGVPDNSGAYGQRRLRTAAPTDRVVHGKRCFQG